MKNTIVLVTYGKHREHLHGDCVDALRHDLHAHVLQTRAHIYIEQARSELATAALDMGADVTVFIDHDMLFDPHDVERLADVARETQGVVGAPYSQRRMGGNLVGAVDADVGEAVFYEGGGLYPATGVIGMGFTAIHRKAYELLNALPEYEYVITEQGTIRPYFKRLVVNGRWLKEDASFCHAVRSAGGSTQIDTRFRVSHLGDYAYRIEDCRVQIPQQETLKLRLRATE